MEKPRSQADVAGYIYTFEIRGQFYRIPAPTNVELKYLQTQKLRTKFTSKLGVL